MSNILNELSKEQHNTQLHPNINNLLQTKTANEWIEIGRKMPKPEPLFGTIWSERECAILFAAAGVGKTALLIVIIDAITRGNKILGLNSSQSVVLYLDCELSTKQFQQRYSDHNGNPYKFNDNFYRAEIDYSEGANSQDLKDGSKIFIAIKNEIKRFAAQVVIIDNITFLSATTEKTNAANVLMMELKSLCREQEISLLIIAHTPKRDKLLPLNLDDLAGSKALANFIDVAFCMGESVLGPGVKYIKQLKARSYEKTYGSTNVINCLLSKDSNFLNVEFTGFGEELDHLQQHLTNEKHLEAQRLKQKGLTNVEIGLRFKVSEKTIRNWLKKLNSDS